MAEYINRTKLKEDSEYNPVSGEYLSYSRGQIWNVPAEKVIDISVLDKIKEDIKRLKHQNTDMAGDHWWNNAIDNCLHEIDKYKAESEEVNGR